MGGGERRVIWSEHIACAVPPNLANLSVVPAFHEDAHNVLATRSAMVARQGRHVAIQLEHAVVLWQLREHGQACIAAALQELRVCSVHHHGLMLVGRLATYYLLLTTYYL